MRKIISGGADDPGVNFRLKSLWVYRCWLENKIKTVKNSTSGKRAVLTSQKQQICESSNVSNVTGGHSLVRIRGIRVHRGAAWPRSPALGTSCHCRSPEWSLPRLWEPCRRHSAGMDSCSAGKLAGQGYLGTRKKNRNVIGQYCTLTLK